MENEDKGEEDWKTISLVKWGIPCMIKDEKARGVKKEREKILNKICAPRERRGSGQFWRQHLSAEPVDRLAVINLAEELDHLLNEQSVRDTGICDIRQHIYDQLFNEVTRQITLFCVQQGSLLVRIRDEIWMMREFYKKIYENSLSFICRKTVEIVEHKDELEDLLTKLTAEKKKKEKEISDLQHIIEEKKIIMDNCKVEAESKHRLVVEGIEDNKIAQKKRLQKYLETVVTVKGK